VDVICRDRDLASPPSVPPVRNMKRMRILMTWKYEWTFRRKTTNIHPVLEYLSKVCAFVWKATGGHFHGSAEKLALFMRIVNLVFLRFQYEIRKSLKTAFKYKIASRALALSRP